MHDRPASRSRYPRTALIAVLLGLSVAAVTVKAGPVEHYDGEAYAKSDGRLLYRESHWLFDAAGAHERLVLYRCPDGKPFARKWIRDVPDAQAPDFDLYDARTGYREGVGGDGPLRTIYVRANSRAPERSAALRPPPDLVIDAGFDAFVRTHWTALDRGESLRLDFVVPSRLGALAFRVRKIDDEPLDGRSARRFRLSVAAWYGALLPHIDVVYSAGSHRLLRYEGISNVRDLAGHNMAVRIDFPRAERDATDAQDARRAASQPLDGTCSLSPP